MLQNVIHPAALWGSGSINRFGKRSANPCYLGQRYTGHLLQLVSKMLCFPGGWEWACRAHILKGTRWYVKTNSLTVSKETEEKCSDNWCFVESWLFYDGEADIRGDCCIIQSDALNIKQTDPDIKYGILEWLCSWLWLMWPLHELRSVSIFWFYRLISTQDMFALFSLNQTVFTE